MRQLTVDHGREGPAGGSSVAVAVRRHAVLLVVLTGAIALRVYYQLTYPYAFFFSDSRDYAAAAADHRPYQIRPFGYSLFIEPFLNHPFAWIAIAQHVVGIAILVAGYFFLVRRGVRPWLAGLAMLPWALDARVVTVEHYVLAETAFVAAVAAGFFLLAWRDRVGWVAAVLGGTLLGFAAITRSVGLPLLALVVVYLLIRRAGMLRLAAFAVPVVAILGGYLIWYHQTYGVYAFGQFQGRFLYARVMPIADCDKLRLTVEQRRLCMPEAPPTWAQRPDQYLWSATSPARRFYPTVEDDPFLNEFATTVIEQRPGAYLAMVGEQTLWHLRRRAPLTDIGACLAVQWVPPAEPGGDCQPRYYMPTDTSDGLPPPAFLVDNADARRLHAYGEIVTTPGPLYAAGALVALVAAVWRPRRRPWRSAADGLLFTGGGLALVVVSVATSIFDYRYAVPAVLLVPIGLALGITRIAVAGPRPADAPSADAPTADAPTAHVPAAHAPAAHVSAAHAPSAHVSAAHAPSAHVSAAHAPAAHVPAADAPAAHAPAAHIPSAHAPTAAPPMTAVLQSSESETSCPAPTMALKSPSSSPV